MKQVVPVDQSRQHSSYDSKSYTMLPDKTLILLEEDDFGEIETENETNIPNQDTDTHMSYEKNDEESMQTKETCEINLKDISYFQTILRS